MPEPSDLTGNTLRLEHKYRVGAAVHRGPMATLYRAEWDLFDLPVYVRSYESLVKLRLRHRDATRIRWAIESEAGRLRHPNLPDVVDAGIEDPMKPFLVMRLPAGDVLSRRIQRDGRFPVEKVAGIVEQVAAALAYCRDQGAPHRGPTADRVWIGEGDEVLLQGVGEVLYRDDTVSMSGPMAKELLWHIPPESFTVSMRIPEDEGGSAATSSMRARMRTQGTLQGRTLEDDPRAEVYALGCLAYHALNGHHPFFTSVDDATEGIQATINDTPLELKDHPPHSEVWRAVSRALSRDPSDRFHTPEAFAEALAEAAGTTPAPVLEPAEETSELGALIPDESADDIPVAVSSGDAFQIWAWRFTSLVLFAIVGFLLLSQRFEGQTLLVTSDPPGLEIGEEFGHTRESLGETPVLLFDRDITAPLRIFAIGPDGTYGETANYDVSRFQDLGRCRATELQLAYPEAMDDAPAEGSGASE